MRKKLFIYIFNCILYYLSKLRPDKCSALFPVLKNYDSSHICKGSNGNKELNWIELKVSNLKMA